MQELKTTIHYTNRSGVRATCSDCHVPHGWTHKVARKMEASKEVWGWVFGTIRTEEQFEAKRRELAEREWARLQANDSLECRNCHEFDHSTNLASGESTCIDCHKGIAHELPDMSPHIGAATLGMSDIVSWAAHLELESGVYAEQ